MKPMLTSALAILSLTCLATVALAGSRGGGEPDIDSLQQQMASGTLTSRALVDRYLERIATYDAAGPKLAAIVELNPDARAIADALDAERAKQGPRGPLHGIPIVIKANIDSGDKLATTAGSLALANHHAADDAFIVKQLRDAGAVILGKANLSEWANFRSTRSSSGWSSLGGQTRNAYDPARNPCGSSSGSAVAVAADLAVLAVGTETDGSIVCPASINGIVGIKPTLGLVSRDGIIPIAHSQDTAGPMARTVRDAALMLNAMSAADPADPASADRPQAPVDYAADLDPGALAGKRIGVIRNYPGAGAHPRVAESFEAAIAALKLGGAEIVDPIEIEREGLDAAEFEVLLYEFKADLDRYLSESGAPVKSLAEVIAFNTKHAERVMPFFDQEILLMAQGKGDLTDEDYRKALEESKRIAREGIDGAMRQHKLDALIAPSNAPAWLTDHVNGDTFSVGSSSYAAVSGYASITVPAGYTSGLPLGISFIGGAFSEKTLIRIAYAYEQATRHRRPPELMAR